MSFRTPSRSARTGAPVRIEVLAGAAGEVTQTAALRAQAEAFAAGGVAHGATIDDAVTALRVVSLYSPGSN